MLPEKSPHTKLSKPPLKRRLDLIAAERHPEHSRHYLQSMIMQGKLLVNGKVHTKPGLLIAETADITLNLPAQDFVSRAGHKLAAALDHFQVTVADKVALDAGISTGGFSHCLLQRGIKRIYGVDVGYGQVHEAVSNDPRVTLLERTNLRYLGELPEVVDLVTLDLSFISVTKVLPVVTRLLSPAGELIILIKPQFEAGKAKVGRGGIVTDPQTHEEVIAAVTKAVEAHGYQAHGWIPSPILGSSGNKEFLAYFVRKN